MYGKRILGSFGKSQVTNLAITSHIMKKGVIIHINMFSVRSFIEAKFRNKHENITEIIKLILAACVGALAEKISDLLF